MKIEYLEKFLDKEKSSIVELFEICSFIRSCVKVFAKTNTTTYITKDKGNFIFRSINSFSTKNNRELIL